MTMPVTVADWPSTFWMKIGNVTLVAATAALIRVTRIAELRKLAGGKGVNAQQWLIELDLLVYECDEGHKTNDD